MVYIKSWDDFYSQAEVLFRQNPVQTRYMVKYRHCDGKLVLKVTDNTTVLQFKTDQQSDLYRLEKLNNLFFNLAVHGPEHEISTEEGQQQEQEGAGTRRKPRRRG
eukprot:TRINITY_DN12302_c0_g1_i1.p5 TRINITY_DN12302_c0_g1~~TRINITY_DN12302_c0_g1_i1.p5  ORF type:complete len:105 (+),score=12.98 TRINITY_DN12302_c0_g1_i1:74-388(+)